MRIGTAASATVVYSHTAINIEATDASCANASFISAGFATGMRVRVSGGAQNTTRIFTIKSLTSTLMGFYGPAATAEDAVGLTLTGNSYEVIGEVVGFNGPSGAANVIDVTNLGSTAKEKRIGIRDEGQLTLDINFSPTDGPQMAMKNDRANRTLREYEIRLTDAVTGYIPTALNFDAYVTGFAISGSVDNVVKGSLTLEITSAVKWITSAS